MTPVTPWTVEGTVSPRAGIGTVVRGAATMLLRRPGLALAAAAPELVYTFADFYWLESLPDSLVWVALLAFPLGIVAYAWPFALFAAAWEATTTAPLAVVLARTGLLVRTTLVAALVLLVGLPLVVPAFYYGVHYFFAPIVAMREDTARAFAVLRRSKLLVRRHRLATALLLVVAVLWNLATTFGLDAVALSPVARAGIGAVAVASGNLLVAAIAAHAYARWKLR